MSRHPAPIWNARKAISRFGQDKVAVEWKPYIIDPGTNVDGETVESYCKRRWGGSGWTKSLKVEGRKDGANFANPDGENSDDDFNEEDYSEILDKLTVESHQLLEAPEDPAEQRP